MSWGLSTVWLVGKPPDVPAISAFMPDIAWPRAAFTKAPVGSLPIKAATATGPSIFMAAGGMPNSLAVPPTTALPAAPPAPARPPASRASPTDWPLRPADRPLCNAPETPLDAMLPTVDPATSLTAEPTVFAALLMSGAAPAPMPPVRPPIRMPLPTLPPCTAELRPPLMAPVAAPAANPVSPIAAAAPAPRPPVASAIIRGAPYLSMKLGPLPVRCSPKRLPALSYIFWDGLPLIFDGSKP